MVSRFDRDICHKLWKTCDKWGGGGSVEGIVLLQPFAKNVEWCFEVKKDQTEFTCFNALNLFFFK